MALLPDSLTASRYICFALLCTVMLTAPSLPRAGSMPNVLFLFVDDLRPELPTYGHTQVHAPNIERLAQQSLVFRNA